MHAPAQRRAGPHHEDARVPSDAKCDECGIAKACIQWASFQLCLAHASGSKAASSRRQWKVIDQSALAAQAKLVDAVRSRAYRGRG